MIPGEMFITNKAITMAQYTGLFTKKVYIQLYAVYDPEEARTAILTYLEQDKSIDQTLASVRQQWEEKYGTLTTGDKAKAVFNAGSAGADHREMSQKVAELRYNRVNNMHLVTSLNIDKGFFSKLTNGIDFRMVNFSLNPQTSKNWLVQMASQERIAELSQGGEWKIKIHKLPPKYEALGEAGIEQVLLGVQAKAGEMSSRVQMFNDLVASAYQR
jgi:hypothetical protein